MIAKYSKVKDTSDIHELTKQVLHDLSIDLKQAIRNGNYSKVNYLKEQIKKIEQLQDRY